MLKFDYDKIKDMEYDQDRGCYVGKNGEELHVTPYSNGKGYKYDYYDKSPYGNAPHNSTHIKADLNENLSITDNDRDNGKQEKTSDSGCYLTTACMIHLQENFDDNCDELMILRWFRDNFVSQEDVQHYYDIAPIIVNKINSTPDNIKIYAWIYERIVQPCVASIKKGNYAFAYKRYKNSVLILEEQFLNSFLEQPIQKKLKKH